MSKLSRRRWVWTVMVLLLIGSACRFAERMPGLIMGTAIPVIVEDETTPAESDSKGEVIPATQAAEAEPTAKAEIEETRPPENSSTPEPPASSEEINLAVISSEETSKAPKYDIHTRYAALEWKDPRAEAFNEASKQFTLGEIRAFKESVYRIPDEAPFNEYSSFLEIDFAPTASERGIFSVKYEISFYMSGAAHPGHYAHAINYDLQNGDVLALDDLFEQDAPYLEKLSTFCLDDLKARDRLEWEEGALPLEENYRVWNITPDGLLITFDEYQVASYAAGAQTVLIPYETLQPLLRKNGPLSKYTGQ